MFINLHNHFIGSFNDSILRFEDAILKIKKQGNFAIAMTEHNQIPLLFEFIQSSKKFNIKPIIGTEFYFVDDAKKSIELKDNFRYHITLIAKNNQGIKNLIRLNNISWVENFFYKTDKKWGRGQIDWNTIKKYHKGLIMLSGCWFGVLPYTSIYYGEEKTEEKLKKFMDIFGKNDIFLELAYHGLKEEEIANRNLISISKKHNIKCVVTQDAHYLDYYDHIPHNMLISTRFGKKTNFKYKSNQYYLKSEDEMRLLNFDEQYYNNTINVNDLVSYDIDKFKNNYKKFSIHTTCHSCVGRNLNIKNSIEVSNHNYISLDLAIQKVNYNFSFNRFFINKIKKIIKDNNFEFKKSKKYLQNRLKLSENGLNFIDYIEKLYNLPYDYSGSGYYLTDKMENILNYIPLIRKGDDVLTQFCLTTLKKLMMEQ
jgi:DNA polymerase III alpha subunit